MKNLYLGYGCVNATVNGSRLVIDCWETTTSQVVSNMYCHSIKGDVILSKEKDETDNTNIWSAFVLPNTYFLLNVQGQHEVVMYWDGTNVFEVASAWFGGGESCFSVNYKGTGWNKDIRRKKMSIFAEVKSYLQWDEALKAIKKVNFV